MTLQWLKIDIETHETSERPPFFSGSMLRGAIGHALKRVVCINPSFKCEGCFAAQNCLFYDFYEDKNVFHPYRLGIRLQQERFNFSFYLFEEATASLPYILSALKRAFEEVGLTRRRIRVPIARISVGGVTVYDGKEFLSLDAVQPQSLGIDTFHTDAILRFNTPVRIKENNRFARDAVALHTLVGNIHSRYRQLKGEPPAPLGYRVHGEINDSNLNFVEMKRYSNRQRQGMNMGGLKGTITIEGLDKQSYAYLKIGEIIGVGKQTVFGLGDYRFIPNKEGEN